MEEFVLIQTFFRFYIQRKFTLYDYINRTSPEFQFMHAYDQQSWFLFHRCGPLLFFWTAEDRSYRNHQMKLIIIDFSGFRENQNTIEKNEFYEWKIWRTIMKTMNENSFICIKINCWLRKVSSALFFIIDFVQINFFNSWFFFDQTGASSASFFIIDFIQINISTADFSKSTKTSPAFFFIIDSYRSTSDQLVLVATEISLASSSIDL